MQMFAEHKYRVVSDLFYATVVQVFGDKNFKGHKI